MQKIIILGKSNFSRILMQYLIEDGGYQVVGFSVNKDYIADGELFEGLPVFPFENLEDYVSIVDVKLILGIGQKNMGKLREKMFLDGKSKGFEFVSFIHKSVFISDSASFGEGNIILEGSTIAPFVAIGDGNLFWDNVHLAHEDIVGSFNTLSGNVGISGKTEIGSYCYFGKHSMAFDNVIIANYTLVGAGAFVKRNTKEYDVIVPANSITLENKKSTDFF